MGNKKEKKVGVAVLEPYDKKPQLLTVLLTPDYKELIFKYIKFICRDERITLSPFLHDYSNL